MIEVTILSEGKALSGSYELHGVDIAFEFNRIPWARLSFLEGDAAKPEFNIANAADFEPGSNIEIKIVVMNMEGVKSKEEIFKGVVIGQKLELDSEQSILVVEIQDKSRCMGGGRQTRFFERKKDSEIMSELVKKFNSLQEGQWQDSVYQHEKMIQFDCTDWDFLVSRAEANGFLIAVSNGKINLLKADATPGKTHVITYGNSEIYELEMESDASDQFTKAVASAWDFKEQKSLSSTQSANFKPAFGNSGQSNTVKKLARSDNKLLFGGTTVIQELNTWAKANEIRSKLSMMRGRVSVPGMPGVQLGEFVDLKGLGARFDGKALISGVRHRVNPGSWSTDIQLGFTSEPFWRNENIIAPRAGGLLPGVNGLQIGVVTNFEDDPDKEFRVRVKLPAATDDDNSFVWARLSMPEGGKGRGWFFYPEENDEVVLGFLNGDPRQAIILGALFSSNYTPPRGFETLDSENAKKGVVTKSGHSLLFDDKEQLITISTSENNKIVMDEKNQKIEVSDEHENVITMSKDGISIKSQKAIKFEAEGNKLIMDKNGVELTSGKKMTLEASAAMEIKGSKIDLE